MDCDGVLNTDRSLAAMPPDDWYDLVFPHVNSGVDTSELIRIPKWGDVTGGRMISSLCRQTKAQIVASTRWLYIFGPCMTRKWFVERAGIDPSTLHEDWAVDYDEIRPGCPELLMKQEAVRKWLDRHPEAQTFILLDDEPEQLQAFGKRTARCSESDGLSHKAFLKAIQILGRT